MRVRRPWLALAITAAFVIALSLYLTVPRLQTAVRTVLLVPSIFSVNPVRPLEWVGPEPVTEVVTLRPEPDAARGIIVRPRGDGPFPGIVMTLGVAPAPADDPRVVTFTRNFARAGFAVLFVESEALIEERLEPGEVDVIVDAFDVLRSRPYVDGDRVGFVGFSVGGSLALLAAADPRIRDDVQFVNAMGPYYRATDVIRATTTEQICLEGECAHWEPDRLTRRLIRENLLGSLDPAVEARVETLLRNPDPAAAAALPPSGRAVYEMLAHPDPGRFDQRLTDLPQERLRELTVLSPAGSLHGVRARIFVLHARGDRLIPYTESRRIVGEARETGPVYYSELAIFEHVDPAAGGNPAILLRDAVRLLAHVYFILDLTERE